MNIKENTTAQERIIYLREYIIGLMEDRKRAELYKEYSAIFPQLEPQDVFGAFSGLMKDGVQVNDLLDVLGKVIKVLSGNLPHSILDDFPEGSFLYTLMQENLDAAMLLERYKAKFRDDDNLNTAKLLTQLLEELNGYEKHLLKKENILFPFMEKKDAIYEGFGIMWALHDELRGFLKAVKKRAADPETDADELYKLIGQLYFLVFGLIEKEEILMFPAAAKFFDEKEFEDMLQQAAEYDGTVLDTVSDFPGLEFDSPTGKLTFEQLGLILNALPVDISYVDENNILRYFNSPPERIFHRSPASVGRNVRNCHPPKSYDAVDKIIEDFRSGASNRESFRIRLKGRLILIEYYAIKDSHGNYRGVLEASRDITDIRELEGEKRL
ncbi:MAG: PAS domain-containing protein [Eubacteriales bacterium]|nr:PAS domain-containing protein [Eubacteriales bacterium]MDD4717199.1 PAS domain-containing protein [Eubacteriales bacterium]